MIEHFANQVFEDIRSKLSTLDATSDNSASALKAILESRLKQLKLVTREEFDAQSAVLERTRAKLEALEVTVKELEERVKS
ncbi:MAG: accessory factor UbiK family protein [Agarilytica sp.]